MKRRNGNSKKTVLRLLQTFAGVLPSPPGKYSYARHFKGKHGKPYMHSVNHKGSIIKTMSAFFDILTGHFLINLSSSSGKEYAMRIA